MFGLNKISDKLRAKEEIDEQKATEFISDARENLGKNRKIIDKYEVKRGDTIFSIAAKYWENQYLWPDLYILNKLTVSDPDLIYPKDILIIYEKLGNPAKFTKKQMDNIA